MYHGGKKKMQRGGSTSSKVKGPLGPVDTSRITKTKKPKRLNMGGMGMSRMDEDMMGKMRTQMMGGGQKYGMMHGGVPHGERMMKGHGGKASSDIYAMETACNKMAGYNMSLPKGR